MTSLAWSRVAAIALSLLPVRGKFRGSHQLLEILPAIAAGGQRSARRYQAAYSIVLLCRAASVSEFGVSMRLNASCAADGTSRTHMPWLLGSGRFFR